MRTYQVVVLPGDGIGPEVMREALKVLNGALPGPNGPRVECREHPLGAAHYRQTGEILSQELIEECRKSDAVLLSAQSSFTPACHRFYQTLNPVLISLYCGKTLRAFSLLLVGAVWPMIRPLPTLC